MARWSPRRSRAWSSRCSRSRTTCWRVRWPGRWRSPANARPLRGRAQAVTEALAEAWVDVAGVTLADASGPSATDRVPAAVLATLGAPWRRRQHRRCRRALPACRSRLRRHLFDRGTTTRHRAGHRPRQDGTLLGVHALRRHRGHGRRPAAGVRGGRRRRRGQRVAVEASSTTSPPRWPAAAVAEGHTTRPPPPSAYREAMSSASRWSTGPSGRTCPSPDEPLRIRRGRTPPTRRPRNSTRRRHRRRHVQA